MSCCGDNKKFNCAEKISSACVFYSKYFPEYTNLDEPDCTTIEETTEDLYKLMDWVRESISLKDYNPECLDIDKVEDSYTKNQERYLVKDVLEELTERVCLLETSTDEDNSTDIMSLDFKCLTTPCGDQITTMKDLLQTLINEICQLKSQLGNGE